MMEGGDSQASATFISLVGIKVFLISTDAMYKLATLLKPILIPIPVN